jgi:putative acetyltransferase
MEFKALDSNAAIEVAGFFREVFTASEGETEGAALEKLVLDLFEGMQSADIICLGAFEEDLLACVFFSPLFINRKLIQSKPINKKPIQRELIEKKDVQGGLSNKDLPKIAMLSPMAVSTKHQGKGLGQALIQHSIKLMRQNGIDVLVTYGDPAFYSKVGFEPIGEDIIQAPLSLSMPFGWLAQSLNSQPIPVVAYKTSCVAAFNDPDYW